MSEDTIFGKIIRKEIPAQIVFESESILAFRDVNPQAPTHVVVVPKKAVRNLIDIKREDRELLGDMLLAINEIARSLGLSHEGYRVVINSGERAGQKGRGARATSEARGNVVSPEPER